VKAYPNLTTLGGSEKLQAAPSDQNERPHLCEQLSFSRGSGLTEWGGPRPAHSPGHVASASSTFHLSHSSGSSMSSPNSAH